MRIRKHAKISPLLFTCSSSSNYPGAAVALTHVCQLNQSPWDAITFPPLDPASLPPPPPPFLVDGEFYRSYMANRALANHIAAEQSREKWDDIAAGVGAGGAVVYNGGDEEYDQKSKLKKEIEGEEIIPCRKTDKKGWQCGERVKAGHSYCERHSSKGKKISNTGIISSSKSSPAHSKKPERRARSKNPPPPPSSSAASSYNPCEFYYYSGFGPRWGKRRGPNPPAAAVGSKAKSSSSSSPENGSETSSTTSTSKGIAAAADPEDDNGNNSNSPDYHQEGNYNGKWPDYVEGDEDEYDDFDDDDENGEMGKKRARKPIKARSLKSLM